jgi:ribosomal protein S27AE
MEQLPLKKCNQCQRFLPISAFGKKPGGLYGVDGRCKACNAAYIAEWRKHSKAKSITPEYAKAYRAEQMRLHPDREKARRIVQYAIRKRILVRKPCVRCGAEPADAHHRDYSRPLYVVWLCSSCHHDEHGAIERGEATHGTQKCFPFVE